MIDVYMLQHVHEWGDGHEDVKLIGIYSTPAKAAAALNRVRDQPGFRERPEGFHISQHTIDPQLDGWPQGYITAHPDGTFSQ
jgi:hypothetical protein